MKYDLKRLGASEASNIYRQFLESYQLPETADHELRVLLYGPLMEVIDMAEKTGGSSLKYRIDLDVGLRLYKILSVNEIGMRTAADTDFWRYISLLVLPDIVQRRYPDNATRFWQNKRRIWLKAVWWYIHLSWQESEESTRAVLSRHSTDEIVQLVERSGRNGYRVSLYREIMRQSINRSTNALRVVMKFNTARLMTTEPSLYKGGVTGYVDRLYEKIK